MDKCFVCGKNIPIGLTRLSYKTDSELIIHFHLECEKKFDREKAEHYASEKNL